MKHSMTSWVVTVAAVAAAACTNRAAVETASAPIPETSAGDVAISSGAWIDSAGGTWMDASGALYIGGANGTEIGLTPEAVAAMSDANIVAHVASSDSLEVLLSQPGITSGVNPAVRAFAQRMVDVHSAHMRHSEQVASTNSISALPSPIDTTDAELAARLMNGIVSNAAVDNFDRDFMRAEVMMHQHVLHELQLVQPQASGAARTLVDQTIPVVAGHLRDAEALWRQVTGTR